MKLDTYSCDNHVCIGCSYTNTRQPSGTKRLPVGLMIDMLGNMSVAAGSSSYKVPSAGQSAEVVLKLTKNPPVLSFLAREDD